MPATTRPITRDGRLGTWKIEQDARHHGRHCEAEDDLLVEGGEDDGQRVEQVPLAVEEDHREADPGGGGDPVHGGGVDVAGPSGGPAAQHGQHDEGRHDRRGEEQPAHAHAGDDVQQAGDLDQPGDDCGHQHGLLARPGQRAGGGASISRTTAPASTVARSAATATSICSSSGSRVVIDWSQAPGAATTRPSGDP